MPSPRQLRTLLIGVMIGVVFVLFYTSSLRSNEVKDGRTVQDFYHKTVNGLNKKPPPGQAVLDQKKGKPAGHVPVDKDADGDIDDDDAKLAKDMAGRLKAAEDKAKELANKKSPLKPDPPSEVVGKGNSAAGQDKKKEKTGTAKEVATESKKEDKKEESDEEHAVEVELNTILKKSPVIIFSKSYCPYSKKAKEILLNKYSIEPAPFVVELDKHPLGPQLQAFLGEKTGRKTVPNILVNSVSIGGGDDIVELDEQQKLLPRIVDLGQKKVEMKLQTAGGSKKKD
ncbi:glutaredoxin domain-containing protein [Colletotrichum truncatum]|uniref:Glutaredoxin domain-containing protein n=1 Tax=Colletotrichum truncatum TaxID=5467 RepID=A0ACC3YWV7_COLTU|nr:glutaredoxin domain-containing protein [Colletotrichum truncatum]KAF6792606.1 glutaredoxin domain-containing protein [Colletotrichum truncatum]